MPLGCAQVLEEKVALEGWVRGSVAEQTETCTRLKSIQVGFPPSGVLPR